MQGEKCKYSVMRHKNRSTKENAPGREGKEEQGEVAAGMQELLCRIAGVGFWDMKTNEDP